MEETEKNILFIQFIKQYVSVAEISLGRQPNSITGKFEKNISHAEIAVNMLKMIADKTKGNLSSYEDKYLKNSISELSNFLLGEVDNDKLTHNA
ncbi:MAG: DUF1844 domain-containing protein [Ignavibacteriaceae bacterium]|nr:DUF1844 domain-containing protein [Ignavibacteriaceae bacterium]